MYSNRLRCSNTRPAPLCGRGLHKILSALGYSSPWTNPPHPAPPCLTRPLDAFRRSSFCPSIYLPRTSSHSDVIFRTRFMMPEIKTNLVLFCLEHKKHVMIWPAMDNTPILQLPLLHSEPIYNFFVFLRTAYFLVTTPPVSWMPL